MPPKGDLSAQEVLAKQFADMTKSMVKAMESNSKANKETLENLAASQKLMIEKITLAQSAAGAVSPAASSVTMASKASSASSSQASAPQASGFAPHSHPLAHLVGEPSSGSSADHEGELSFISLHYIIFYNRIIW